MEETFTAYCHIMKELWVSIGGYTRTLSVSGYDRTKEFAFNVQIKISNLMYMAGQKY